MKELLKEFEDRPPEVVLEWNDTETEARGWVVINSLRNGAAGGGTRMRPGLDRSEVESLAKTMEVKFTVCGPSIGGAKSGIDFDPQDPRKLGVLERWYRSVYPLLKHYYGTGGDLNVDEIQEVIPLTEHLGLWHPQEGIVNGYYHASEPQKIKMLGQLRQGVSKIIEDHHYTPSMERKYTVADMITGFGVAESVRHYYRLRQQTLSGKKAIIQGWGNVGASAAFYLANAGVKIIGIIDKNGGLIHEEGFDPEQIRNLFLNRNRNALHDLELQTFDETNDRIWDLPMHICVPAAASRLLSRDQVDRMNASGLEVMACGANVPFADKEIFYGPIMEFADNRFALIPDFLANCGMARVFAYLMTGTKEMTDEALFNDVSQTISQALEAVYARNQGSNKLASTAYEIALEQLLG